MLNKIGLKQFDSGLTGAMERAVNLGPWEEVVQSDVAFSGLKYWDSLQIEAYPWVALALDKIMIMQDDPTALAKDIQNDPNIGILCRSIEPTFTNQLKKHRLYCP